MPSPDQLESDIAKLATSNLSSTRPRTLMEDFTTLEKQADLLRQQMAELKRRVQNFIGTP